MVRWHDTASITRDARPSSVRPLTQKRERAERGESRGRRAPGSGSRKQPREQHRGEQKTAMIKLAPLSHGLAQAGLAGFRCRGPSATFPLVAGEGRAPRTPGTAGHFPGCPNVSRNTDVNTRLGRVLMLCVGSVHGTVPLLACTSVKMGRFPRGVLIPNSLLSRSQPRLDTHMHAHAHVLLPGSS